MLRIRQPENHAVIASSQSSRCALLADDFLTRLCLELHRDSVAHRAGGQEQGSFLAQNFGGALFELIDGWILAVDIVADFGRGHGAAHRLGWLGNGIAP
jgi:hypothetical protein